MGTAAPGDASRLFVTDQNGILWAIDLATGNKSVFLDVSARLGGFGPEGVLLVYEALSGTAERISFETQATLRERSVSADGDGWVRVGDRIVLDIADPSEVVGASVVVRVTGSLDEASVSDERTVTVVDAE